MCHHHIIESVKSRMASRRDVLRLSAGAAGLAALSPVGLAAGGTPARAAAHGKVVDMTHELHPDFPTYFGERQFFAEQKFAFSTDGFNLFELRVNEHTGTHMDAPLHFSADGHSVAEVPVENLVVPLAVIDISGRAETDPDAQLMPEDIGAWIAANGPLPENCCVAMHSGWGAKVASDGFRNADPEGAMHFPGFHPEAAAMLMEESSAVGVAVDTLSLDHGASTDFATHYAWLPTGRWGLEAVANLGAVPAAGATLVVGAPKHRGGSGGPSRVLALV